MAGFRNIEPPKRETRKRRTFTDSLKEQIKSNENSQSPSPSTERPVRPQPAKIAAKVVKKVIQPTERPTSEKKPKPAAKPAAAAPPPKKSFSPRRGQLQRRNQ